MARFFGAWRRPGTMAIGDRKRCPALFQDSLESPTETYHGWLERTVAKTALSLLSTRKPVFRRYADSRTIARLTAAVARILEWRTVDGTPLRNEIPQQMYEDVFTRLVGVIARRSTAVTDVHLYEAFNALCHRLGLAVIDLLAARGIPGGNTRDIGKLIQIAVLSGYAGINLKSTASAASTLLNRNIMPIPREWVRHMRAVARVTASQLAAFADLVLDLSETGHGAFGLSSLASYYDEVVDTGRPTLLVFFSDDYLESMIDLIRFEVMLLRNAKLRVLFVPRSGRYGNDLALEDVPALLDAPQFASVRSLVSAGAIRFSAHGPNSGCIDPRAVSAALLDDIETSGRDRKIIIETKGCRNFEMLQGALGVPWYASFNCNRALSIRTVGVDGPPVFLRIPPGLKAYDGFHQPRIGYSQSYGTRGIRYAAMTTRDLYDALASKGYRRFIQSVKSEYAANLLLTEVCGKRGMTVSQFMAAVEKGDAEMPDYDPA